MSHTDEDLGLERDQFVHRMSNRKFGSRLRSSRGSTHCRVFISQTTKQLKKPLSMYTVHCHTPELNKSYISQFSSTGWSVSLVSKDLALNRFGLTRWSQGVAHHRQHDNHHLGRWHQKESKHVETMKEYI